MENNNLSKIKRNWFKLNINDIINNYENENNYNINIKKKEKFIQIINENINNDLIIKYIIKIISFNAKNTNDIRIQKICYNLFLLLINILSKEDINKYLTNLLVFLQENINNYSIEIGFELILKKLEAFELKTFEVLNGFCLHNMKNNEIKTQKQALLCYEKLIINYDYIIGNKKDILKTFIDNIMLNLNIESLNNKYQLMYCLNKIVCMAKDKYESFIDLTIYYIKDNLFINDNNIRYITLDIINNIIKYNKSHLKEIKNKLNIYFIKLAHDKSIDNNIKRKIFDISNQLNINNSSSNTNIRNEVLKRNKLQEKEENNKKIIQNKSDINVKYNDNIILKNSKKNNELKTERDKIKSKNINKIYKKHNDNIKIEIFVKKDPYKNKNLKRKYTPLNTYKRKLEKQLSTYNDNYRSKIEKNNFTTYINEEGYLNPIKMWKNMASKKSVKNMNNTDKPILKEKNNEIKIDKSIYNSQINIINSRKEEPKMQLILDEIYKISKIQNDLVEKIVSIEKNTFKQISYFNSRIDEIENKITNDELMNINNNNNDNNTNKNNNTNNNKNNNDNNINNNQNIYNDNNNNDNTNNYNNNNYINYNDLKILYPSNTLNGRLISFLDTKENSKSIYYILDITEQDMKKIDNYLIEDVINKLINILDKGIYIHESISFIKKVFLKNKIRFKLNTIKKLLCSLDKVLLTNKKILSSQDSIDISLIISLIDIDKI